MKKDWTNHKIKKWITIYIYVDISTGEIIDEKTYNDYYKTIKNERKRKYSYDRCWTTTTKIGQNIGKQEKLI